jgi:hypothetical protein
MQPSLLPQVECEILDGLLLAYGHNRILSYTQQRRTADSLLALGAVVTVVTVHLRQ